MRQHGVMGKEVGMLTCEYVNELVELYQLGLVSGVDNHLAWFYWFQCCVIV